MVLYGQQATMENFRFRTHGQMIMIRIPVKLTEKTSALTNQKLFTVVMFVNLRLISLEILMHVVMAFRETAFLM